MPKFRKVPEGLKEDEKPKKRIGREDFIIQSSKKSFFLAGLSFLVSILFNTGIITLFENQNTFMDSLDVTIKSISIIMFFLFLCIAVGNILELNGRVLGWKEFTLLILLSILQSIKNGWVVLFTILGIAGIIVYLWAIQEGS